MREYYVYIMTSRSGVIYTGVTNGIARRVQEHKTKKAEGFTAKYNVNRLVYCELTDDVNAAIGWEKQIKGWSRKKKIALIESINPDWNDLSWEWFIDDGVQRPVKPVFRHRDSSLHSE